MAKKYPCIESTLDIQTIGGLIRLWIDEQKVEDQYYDNMGIAQKISDYCISVLGKNFDDNASGYADRIINFIAKEIPRVNAVQIKQTEGEVQHGVVAYLVDFSSDVHG